MRLVRIALFAALALSALLGASPATASTTPACYAYGMPVVTAFRAAAPPGSAWRIEGEARLNQMANNGLSGGIVDGVMFDIGYKYGYEFDCSKLSFVSEAPATSSTTSSSTTTTTFRAPTTSSTTTTTRLQIDYPDINIVVPTYPVTPPPTSAEPRASVTTGPTAPPASVAVAAATASSGASTTTSSTTYHRCIGECLPDESGSGARGS